MGYAQKTCEDCGKTFTSRTPSQATKDWADHIKDECPKHHPPLGMFSEELAKSLPGWGDLGKE